MITFSSITLFCHRKYIMYISVGKYRKRSLIIIYIDHRNASYRRTTDIYIEILNKFLLD